MSFLRKLFGSNRQTESDAHPAANSLETDHKGFTIRPAPQKVAGQYQVAGVIEKMVDGVARQHAFVRADRSPSLDEANELAMLKGRLLIDQQGESLFR